MPVIAFSSPKGGAGKTTAATILATVLRRRVARGRRALPRGPRARGGGVVSPKTDRQRAAWFSFGAAIDAGGGRSRKGHLHQMPGRVAARTTTARTMVHFAALEAASFE